MSLVDILLHHEVCSVRADVSEFEHEVPSKLALDIEVPLLRITIGVPDIE